MNDKKTDSLVDSFDEQKDKDQEIIDLIEHDLSGSKTFHDETIANVSDWIKAYDGEPYGNEVDGRSKIVYKLIKKQGEALISNIAKPFTGNYEIVEIDPIKADDLYKSKIDSAIINHFWQKEFDSLRFIKMLARVMVREGSAIIRAGWEYEETEKTVKIPKSKFTQSQLEKAKMANADIELDDENVIIKVKKVTSNHATATLVKIEDIYIDPTAESIEESKFIIHKKITSFGDVKKDPLYNEEALKRLEKVIDQNDDDYTDGDNIHNYNTTDFEFSDKTRKKITLYEYFGEYDINDDGTNEQVVAVMAEYGDEKLSLEWKNHHSHSIIIHSY